MNTKPVIPFGTTNIQSRGLPKTGQITSYAAEDDGFYEAGWWQGLFNANNRNRFNVSGAILLDRATNLMWPVDGNGAGGNFGGVLAWAAAVAYAAGLNFAGFTDWRLPNYFELCTILNLDAALGINPKIHNPPFINTVATDHWTGTTYPVNTAWAYEVDFFTGQAIVVAKGANFRLRCVRGGV